ncbi:hypothetical protein RND71_031942 [Anisodus tanguticus]|uniref:Uncharacterized protein n=1 Tax=Anisodus tanguticus TaxID=243964 RepID=A0AAE1REG6_9SOLA|nr:hypothetical protein RND71_031942 [Anisodus tanguticus]
MDNQMDHPFAAVHNRFSQFGAYFSPKTNPKFSPNSSKDTSTSQDQIQDIIRKITVIIRGLFDGPQRLIRLRPVRDYLIAYRGSFAEYEKGLGPMLEAYPKDSELYSLFRAHLRTQLINLSSNNSSLVLRVPILRSSDELGVIFESYTCIEFLKECPKIEYQDFTLLRAIFKLNPTNLSLIGIQALRSYLANDSQVHHVYVPKREVSLPNRTILSTFHAEDCDKSLLYLEAKKIITLVGLSCDHLLMRLKLQALRPFHTLPTKDTQQQISNPEEQSTYIEKEVSNNNNREENNDDIWDINVMDIEPLQGKTIIKEGKDMPMREETSSSNESGKKWTPTKK